MAESTASSDESSVLDGRLWLMKLYEGRRGSESGFYSPTTSAQAVVQFPGVADATVVPAGTVVTFFQPYPKTVRYAAVVTIFLKEKQITIHSSGRVTQRRYPS